MATLAPGPSVQIFKSTNEEKTLSFDQEEILRLKKEKNAILLCHNYQIDAIQQISDYVGDSLGLARQAAETDAEIIVFCGVHFHGGNRKNPQPRKTVLLPDMEGRLLAFRTPVPQRNSLYTARITLTSM